MPVKRANHSAVFNTDKHFYPLSRLHSRPNRCVRPTIFLYMSNSTDPSQIQSSKPLDIETMPLRLGHYKILIVASMGQMLGAALSTLIGIMIPMIQLVIHPELSSWQQGIMGCTSLIGITIGSVIIGKLSDRYGYLFFFRL